MLEKFKDIIEDVQIWFQHSFIGKIYFFFKRLPKNIKNLIDFFPFVWRDRDWDHSFLEDLLKFKLERMYKFFSDPSKTNILEAQKYADEIKFVLDCLYTDSEWELTKIRKKHEEKYGEFNCHFIPYNDNSQFSEMLSSYSKTDDPKVIEQADQESFILYKLEEEIRWQNFQTGMEVLKERLKYWWD